MVDVEGRFKKYGELIGAALAHAERRTPASGICAVRCRRPGAGARAAAGFRGGHPRAR